MTDDTDNPTDCGQLGAAIRARITGGALAPGAAAPSITELAAQRGWPRQTCAMALRMLADEGSLVRYPGLGFYVAGRD